MSQGLGVYAYAGIGVQSAYGTAVAGAIWAEIKGESMKGTRPRIPVGVLGSRSLKRTVKGQADVAGGLSFPMQWNGLESFLKHAFGSVSTSGAGPYTHTFALAAQLPAPGLTVLVNRDAANVGTGSMFRYVGCHISKLTLGQKINEVMMVDAEFIGSDYGNVNIQAATFPTWDPIEYGQMTVANFDQAGTPYGMKIREWQLVIDNKIEPTRRLTDYKSAGAQVQDQREVTFMADIEFDSLTAWASFRDATEEDYQFKWVSSTRSLTIDIPKAYLTGDEPETSGPGPYYLKLNGRCTTETDDNEEIGLALVNSTAGAIA